jgi:hypothetical protein
MARRWIIEYAAQIPTGPQAHMAEAIIAPLTLQNSFTVHVKIACLCYDPGLRAYAASPRAVLPLATVLFVADGRRPARAVTANVPPPPAYGIPAFV